MSDNVKLDVERRERLGKGGARATRREGRVPAIVYGGEQPPLAISLDTRELQKQFKGHGFFSRVFELNLGGETQRVLARELQTHPVTGHPLHLDFLRFGATTRVDVEVEVIFENEEACPGLKKGGMLNIVLHTVSLACLADRIPESIKVDLTGRDIGDAIHIGDLGLPEGVEPANQEADATVAVIAAPTVAGAEGDEDEGAAEDTAEGASDET